MIKIGGLGNYETVPPRVAALLAGDTAALDRHRAARWNLDARLDPVGETPMVIALAVGADASVRWLVEHGAKLNLPDAPAFPEAAFYGNSAMLRYLAAQGADVNICKRVGGDAFCRAVSGDTVDVLPVIEGLGHKVADHGGEAFRSAVFDCCSPYSRSRHCRAAVAFFLAHGVDVDYHERDMVHSDAATALSVAARYGNAEMCHLLIEHSADVTLADRNGGRPYTVALEAGHAQLAAWLKTLEPPEWHDAAHKLQLLKPYKLSKALISFLQGNRLRLDLEMKSSYGIRFVDFFALADTVPFRAGRRKLLRISRETDNYSHVWLVWNPRSRKIGYWDMEHEEYGDIADCETFLADPTGHMRKVIEGDYAPDWEG